MPLFKNPSHYLGTELNSIHKQGDAVSLRWALAFPDVYPVAISYLGQHILYHILNSHPQIWAERVYAPSLEVGKLLKEKNAPLTTLESDTPLKEMDVVGFSLTHELCYTTVLYMLDLADIPFFSEERKEDLPLIIAGGEAVYNPEPIMEIFDVFVIGDGEDIVREISEILLLNDSKHRDVLLQKISNLPGVLVPRFHLTGQCVKKRIYSNFHKRDYPIKQIVPFGRPIHDRYTVEISKGCTRGCRFCYAGMVNRPLRERPLEQIKEIMIEGLENTGYGEVGFLSLSTGDFSSLMKLFSFAFSYCFDQQISLSLPSLRAGSIEKDILTILSRLKRTGLTIAPEAGTQRLRNVINKGITEDDIIQHVRWAFENNWEHIKLYFMIGLPTETEEDLRGIWELSKKLLSMAPSRKRVRISVSISPFVPKPHTPFQWERQTSLEENKNKIAYLKQLFKKERRLYLSWPILEMSIVEGIFSRGDRNLTKVILEAYKKGDVFTSWRDFFDFSLWEAVFESFGVDYTAYLGERDISSPLPWEYVLPGINKKFLLKERKKAYSTLSTEDCRIGRCAGCGVCDFNNVYPLLNRKNKEKEPLPPLHRKENFFIKRFVYRIWFRKIDEAKYLSQIELQSVLDKILRRANVPVSFSGGFHPRPRISFGRALPVGVASMQEWFVLYTWSALSREIIPLLNKNSITGIEFLSVEEVKGQPFSRESVLDLFGIKFRGTYAREYLDNLLNLNKIHFIQKKGKKIPVKDIIRDVIHTDYQGAEVLFSWEKYYINPLEIIEQICCVEERGDIDLTKKRQFFSEVEWREWKKKTLPGSGS